MSDVLRLYAVRDRKVGNFSSLLPMRNDATAHRVVQDLLRSAGDSPLTRYPEDFELFALGDIDTDSGHITALEIPEFVLSFKDVLNSMKEVLNV